MFTQEEIEEARGIDAHPDMDRRSKLTALRILRAHAAHRMDAISRRSNGSPQGNDAEAYERCSREFNEHEAELLRLERDEGREDEERAERNPILASIGVAERGGRGERNSGPYLGERRFAEAFGIPTAEERDAEAFSVGALIQALAGTRELEADSAELRALTGAGAGGAMVPTAVASGLLDGVFAASTVHEACTASSRTPSAGDGRAGTRVSTLRLPAPPMARPTTSGTSTPPSWPRCSAPLTS